MERDPIPQGPKCPKCGWRIGHVGIISGYTIQNCMARDCHYSTRPALLDTAKRNDDG
jgi:hypothetical protein